VVETENAVQNAKRDIVVAIDAGHGGEDPGASGPSKTREKHVVLEIAKELKATIDGQPGFKAVLVRQGDYYVQHKRRWEIARENKADLFISIHADAFTDPRAKGSSVFALSRKGTTSAMARFLADSENVDLAGEVSLGDQEEMVAKTLTDLVMTSSLVASLDVGERIIGTMDDVTHLHSKRVELANFRVLKAPDVPSILIETGFISNPEEEKKLISKSHQRKLANAITEGVTSYFKSNPPMGTFLAWQREQTELNTHVVGRGESLTKIANSYGVTLDALKQANNLKKNTIHVGQKLRIPKG
jgi:N-acetylmuramoyl-L-alanine amidase